MNKLLCRFHFQLTGNHLAQNTLHEICWLGSIFLSRGKRKTPIFRLLQNGCVINDDKKTFEEGVGRGSLSGTGGEDGLTPEPAKQTGALP